MSFSRYQDNQPRLAFKVYQKENCLSRFQKLVLCHFSTFSGPVIRKQEFIAKDIGCSISALQKACRVLVRLGFLKRKYGVFKRVIYIVSTIKEQISAIKNPVKNIMKTLMKSSVPYRSADLNPSPKADSTKDIFNKEKCIKNDLNLGMKTLEEVINPIKKRTAQEMIAEYRAHLAANPV